MTVLSKYLYDMDSKKVIEALDLNGINLNGRVVYPNIENKTRLFNYNRCRNLTGYEKRILNKRKDIKVKIN